MTMGGRQIWRIMVFSIFAVFNSISSASLMTFDVDLKAVGASGHTLRAFGTLMVDPDTDLISGSNLFFQHQDDTPVALPSLPFLTVSAPANLDWGLSGGDLYVTRLTDINSFIEWSDLGPSEFNSLALGSGSNRHRLLHSDSGLVHVDEGVLKERGLADGPNGFLVGTAQDSNLVPEPSTFATWGGLLGLCIVGGALRHRRKWIIGR